MKPCQHWSQVEYLHLTVSNPNIHLKGRHSYYSGAWDGPFEEHVVRYLHGDRFSRSPETGWEPLWHIDQLHIGDYVQIAAGVKIIMGGNQTHNTAFISTYPFSDVEALRRSYRPAGDTRIGNDVWLGMDAMIMPGVTIGDGAIIAARAWSIRMCRPMPWWPVRRPRLSGCALLRTRLPVCRRWPGGSGQMNRCRPCCH